MALTKKESNELARMQEAIVAGRSAAERRNGRLVELSKGGATQRELAEALSTGSVKAGGEPLTERAVQKAISRHIERFD